MQDSIVVRLWKLPACFLGEANAYELSHLMLCRCQRPNAAFVEGSNLPVLGFLSEIAMHYYS